MDAAEPGLHIFPESSGFGWNSSGLGVMPPLLGDARLLSLFDHNLSTRM